MDLLVVMEYRSLTREEVFLRIHAKHTRKLCKKISLSISPQYEIQYLVLYYTDKIVMQKLRLGM